MIEVYIGLGSNKGDRMDYLNKAVDFIEQNGAKIIKKSSIIETESWGFKSTPFLNQVILIETNLSPFQLLEQFQLIEKELGRNKKSKQIGNQVEYHDRTIDIDILLYGNQIINNKDLIIPHPEMQKRDFVMIPFQEIADEKALHFLNHSIKRSHEL